MQIDTFNVLLINSHFRMLYPMWEETLLINEDIKYILNADNNVILFFELIEFMSFTTASATYSNKGKLLHK